MAKKFKTTIKIFTTMIVLAALWMGVNTFPIWRDYVAGPPVRFLEDKYVRLGLYPSGYRSASVFTNDDIYALTPSGSIERLRLRLKEWGVKGTFFVIPFHYGRNKLQPDSLLAEMLRKLKDDGHEIAQHGDQHYCERNEGSSSDVGAEMAFLSRKEQEGRLKEGRKILAALGFLPVGHRSPCFSGTEETFQALNALGYLYGSDLRLPPATFETVFLPVFRGRIFYPYHPSGLRLWEILCQADPTVQWDKAMEIFQRFHRRGGVFVFLTHLPQVSEPEKLKRLEEFIGYLKAQNTWLCRLDELCRWWGAREGIVIKTEKEGSELVISYRNPGGWPLVDACFFFKEGAASCQSYRLVGKEGEVISEGKIPLSRRVIVHLPPPSLRAE